VIGGASAYDQAAEALRRVVEALETVGATAGDVVQTRLYLTDVQRWEEVGRAHREVFGDVRPAATLVEVSALIDPRMLVEIEAVAVSTQAAEPAGSA
jgi:enamine deaminase RidA (YjgF/YER057c/UK114 family)